MIASTINQRFNIKIIFVYIPAEQFRRTLFSLKLPEGWMFLKVKMTDNANMQFTKLGGNKVLRRIFTVDIAPPGLFWFFQTFANFNLLTPCVIA